jgi:hypothetical protein
MGVFEDLDRAELASAAVGLPWPSVSTDLRALGENWQHHALLGWQRGRSHGPIYGYREAAEVLAERMAASTYGLDSLVYPFVQCWRHHIELALKDLLNDLLHLDGRPGVNRRHHKISNLWQEVRPLIVASHGGDADLVHVDRVLDQLAGMDPDGQEFRYHVRQDGTPTLPGVDRLDVANFHEAMLGVSDYLIAVSTATDVAISAKAEMLEHWGMGNGW